MNDYLVNKEDLDAIANAINRLDRNYEQLNFPEGFINKLTNIADYVQNLSFKVNTYRCSVTEYTPTVMQTTVVNLTVTPDDDTCYFPGFSYNNYKDCVTVTGAEYTLSLSDDERKGYLTIFNITDNVTVDIKCRKTFKIIYNIGDGIIFDFDHMSNALDCAINEEGIASIYLKCSEGFTLPEDVEIENAEYSYNKSNRSITVKNPTGDVTVKVRSGVRRMTRQGDNYTLTLKEKLPNIQYMDYSNVEALREYEENRHLSFDELVEKYHPDYYRDEYFYYIRELSSGYFHYNDTAYLPPSVDSLTYELRVNEGYEYPTGIPLKIRVPLILPGGINSHKTIIYNDMSISGCDFVYDYEPDAEHMDLTLANFNSDEIKINITVHPEDTE
jgi:hypothetical protein